MWIPEIGEMAFHEPTKLYFFVKRRVKTVDKETGEIKEIRLFDAFKDGESARMFLWNECSEVDKTKALQGEFALSVEGKIVEVLPEIGERITLKVRKEFDEEWSRIVIQLRTEEEVFDQAVANLALMFSGTVVDLEVED